VNTTRLRNHCCKDPDAVRDVGRREQALGHAQRRRARNGKPLAACTMSSSLRDAIKNAERVERDFRASVDAQVWAYDMASCHLCVHRRMHRVLTASVKSRAVLSFLFFIFLVWRMCCMGRWSSTASGRQPDRPAMRCWCARRCLGRCSAMHRSPGTPSMASRIIACGRRPDAQRARGRTG